MVLDKADYNALTSAQDIACTRSSSRWLALLWSEQSAQLAAHAAPTLGMTIPEVDGAASSWAGFGVVWQDV